MRVLIDENLDWRLSRHLPGHEVDSVVLIGWSGMKNGVLMRQAASAGYQVLPTLDGNLVYQQNIANQAIAVIALKAATNRLADAAPLMHLVLACLPDIKTGQVVHIG